MKLFKRIIILVLSIVLTLPSLISLHVSALVSPLSAIERAKVIESLREIEPQKSAWGLTEICFNDLCIGAPVYAYECVNDALQFSRKLYPITANDQLVLWAIADNGKYQLSNELVDEVNHAITEDTPFALLYDSNCAYIYANGVASQIKEFPYTVKHRTSFQSETNLGENQIATATLCDNVSIGYGALPRTITNTVSCSVSYVPQNYENTCWAATIACIYNYLNNLTGTTAWTDERVAREVKGNDFNVSLFPEHVITTLSLFDIHYSGTGTGDASTVSASLIHSSISRDYPVFGCFEAATISAHAGTIYTSNLINGTMTVMDPASGPRFLTIRAGGGYHYVSAASNITYVLTRAFYKAQ